MTLNEFAESFLGEKRIILCDWKTQQGYQVQTAEELRTLVATFTETYYILKMEDAPDFMLLEYFTIKKAPSHVVVVRHPLMTNAYWKDLPDKTNDVFALEGIYRNLTIDYGKLIREYVIELPTEIESKIFKHLRTLMPKSFRTKPSKNQTISILFTNSNRFKELDQTSFVTYNLEELYPEWDVKKITALNLSRKVWSELKDMAITSNPEASLD